MLSILVCTRLYSSFSCHCRRDMQQLLLLDSDSDTDDLVLEQLMVDEEDSKLELLERKQQGPFTLDKKSDSWCIEHCRYDKATLLRLVEALRIPEQYVMDNGSVVPGTEAFVVLLNRLSYPNRLSHHIRTFGRSSSMISRIFNCVLSDLHERFHTKLDSIHHDYVDYEHLCQLVASISPLSSCIGFIDGTVRPMCRPIYDQRTSYNGHKRTHAIKFQGVMFPDGIIAAMNGPFEGKRHDATLLQESPTMQQMDQLPLRPDATKYVLYGDPAYPLLEQLITPFRGDLTPEQTDFNKSMSRVRESVEYGFGKIEQYYAFANYKKNLKLYLQPIGKIYLVATLLTNCHTCLYGSNVNSVFKSQPPPLEDYLVI